MPVLISHPTGNEFFRAAAKGFYDAGMLHSIYTSLASFPGTFSYELGGIEIFSDIRRRAFDNSFREVVRTYPGRELGRLVAMKTGSKKLVQHEKGIFSVDAVYQSLDKYVAKGLKKEQAQGATALYAYEDGAFYSFCKAKETGLKCFYDLPIGYWRTMHEMLSAEKEINPEWAATLGGFKDSKEKLNHKDEEIHLADKLFVASSFTAASLHTYPGKLPQVYVVPYGFPPARPKSYGSFGRNQKVKLLFVGSLSQRKGLSYLFKAVEGLKDHVSLTVVGSAVSYDCRPLKENLGKHTWIKTLPHKKVLELMQEHDVLIFPSLFEGFGLVITEAMAQGTPVITTERTVGPDIIKHGENGWLVKAGSAEAIREVLEQVLLCPVMIADAGRQAVRTAETRSWKVYGSELAEMVKLK